MNEYIGKTYATFRCPSDKGDYWAELNLGRATTNCYNQYGNSYLTQWGANHFKVLQVCGRVGSRQSLRQSEVARSPQNKIIQGDWIWHANRDTTQTRHIWHNYKGQTRMIMLFGDGHAEYFKFPGMTDMMRFNTEQPDPNHLWW